MAADQDENEDDDSLSLGIYRACDWSAPRSWLALLGLGLAFGTVCGLLVGIVAVQVFGRSAASIDADYLAYTARVITIGLIIHFVVCASIEAGFLIWIRRDPDLRLTPRRIESFKGAAILAILFAAMFLPLLATVCMVLEQDEPAGSDPLVWVFVALITALVAFGPEAIRACLERWCPPIRSNAD